MGRYEISITEPFLDYGTSSGTLEMPESEARELYDSDRAALDVGQTITLLDLDRDAIIATFTA